MLNSQRSLREAEGSPIGTHESHHVPCAEVDAPPDVASGDVPGVKRAAIRKLQQELGIAPGQLPIEAFKFLTRLHYCAADTGAQDCMPMLADTAHHTVILQLLPHDGLSPGWSPPKLYPSQGYADTWGPDAEWGEHEIDYILLAKADVEVQPNPDEVMVSARKKLKIV
jgi:isopentenyldiphosphate isomerase